MRIRTNQKWVSLSHRSNISMKEMGAFGPKTNEPTVPNVLPVASGHNVARIIGILTIVRIAGTERVPPGASGPSSHTEPTEPEPTPFGAFLSSERACALRSSDRCQPVPNRTGRLGSARVGPQPCIPIPAQSRSHSTLRGRRSAKGKRTPCLVVLRDIRPLPASGAPLCGAEITFFISAAGRGVIL